MDRFQRIKFFKTILFVATTCFASLSWATEWSDLPNVSINKSARFSAGANGYYTQNKLVNNSGETLIGPIRLTVTSSTHTVTNANGFTEAGEAYFDLLSDGQTLADGATSTTVRINFALKRGVFANTLVAQQSMADLGTASTVNDTGITTCTIGYLTNPPITCPAPGFPNQDAELGRDVTHNDDSDGHAGFNFTKIATDGSELASDATDWSCVKDNVTGLIWQRDAQTKLTNFSPEFPSVPNQPQYGSYGSGNDTVTIVNDVNSQGLCGSKDWRLPSVVELQSILDYSVLYPGPNIDQGFFPNTPPTFFWTSARRGLYYAYIVSFNSSNSGSTSLYEQGSVRLVRGNWLNNAGAERYTLSADTTEVTDNKTGLIWKSCPEGSSHQSPEGGYYYFGNTRACGGTTHGYNWQQALQLTSGEWRLPNIKELATLDNDFPVLPYNYLYDAYWSTTPQLPFSGISHSAWSSTWGGSFNPTSFAAGLAVRLVRSAP